MAVTLLFWACLAGHPDDCRIIRVADGFTSDETCIAASQMTVKGWLDLHPGVEPRAGIPPLCTDKPDYYIGRFGA